MKPFLETDVLVIGAGASGWPAAIGAAREGARVVLLDDDPYPGGAAVEQYVSMPDGGPRSGIVAEMLTQLESRFALTQRPIDKWWYFWYMPSDIMRVVSDLLVAEKRIKLVCPVRATRLTVKEKGGLPRVNGVLIPDETGGERWIKASVVIEATGSGALAEAIGCEARYGEDAREDFNEPWAPEKRTDEVQMCTWMYVSQRIPGIEPKKKDFVPGGLESGYKGIVSKDEQKAAIRRGIGTYLHWGCKVECRDTRDPVALADSQREALEIMRPKLDELRENGYAVHLAPKLGVRESRRIMGEYVVTANDMAGGRIHDDPVLITQRPFDLWRKDNAHALPLPEVKPYGVPYRSLIPKGVEGLFLVGKSMSGTHLAMSSYRVQCLLGQIGQASGIAAALCVNRGAATRDLDYRLLQEKMTAQPQNIILRADAEYVTPPEPQADM